MHSQRQMQYSIVALVDPSIHSAVVVMVVIC